MNRNESQYQTHIFDEFLVNPGSKSRGKQSGNSVTTTSSSVFSSHRQSLIYSVEKDGSLHRNVHSK